MTLDELFAYRNISTAVEATTTGIPDPLPEVFSTLKEEVIGNETTFDRTYGERRIVQRTEYTAPSKPTSQKKVASQSLVMPSFASHVVVDMNLYNKLREIGSLAPAIARRDANTWIKKIVRDHKVRYENNRIAHRVQMLNKGALWFDKDGNLLQSSSGAVVTIDFGIPSENKTNLGGIIDATWSDPSSDIFAHMINLDRKAEQTTGRKLKYGFYGQNVPRYIWKNASFKNYFSLYPQYQQQFAKNPSVIPDGFMDKTWVRMGSCFYENEDESKVQLFGDDNCAFTPEITKDVYTLFEGSTQVPTFVGVQPTEGVTSEVKYGICGYAVHTVDPVQMKLVMIDNSQATWKNGKDLYIATVAF